MNVSTARLSLALLAALTAAVGFAPLPSAPIAPRPVGRHSPGLAPADSSGPFAGTWEARSYDPEFNGNVVMHMELTQRGDSVFGTVTIQQEGMTTENPLDISGVVKSGRVHLSDRGALRFVLDGTVRGSRLQARITPGDADRPDAFNVSFTRAR